MEFKVDNQIDRNIFSNKIREVIKRWEQFFQKKRRQKRTE
ncbi:unnamed protein product [Paramecium sonneborni]|uniref:Uncharacterized protein n=1 Tax=Paramecium sonneborni TaxID=65129 RepID=A0A8S1RGT8_9CILI|nr:unnamed protein product [Paramecium sonneborni]